jgi:hypothetical protein
MDSPLKYHRVKYKKVRPIQPATLRQNRAKHSLSFKEILANKVVKLQPEKITK